MGCGGSLTGKDGPIAAAPEKFRSFFLHSPDSIAPSFDGHAFPRRSHVPPRASREILSMRFIGN
jgi:hypothetical protein